MDSVHVCGQNYPPRNMYLTFHYLLKTVRGRDDDMFANFWAFTAWHISISYMVLQSMQCPSLFKISVTLHNPEYCADPLPK